ncbi:kinase-like domain-containing protein [Rhizophagus irregularis DAOM 181602=DAOM 197198]|nr:kinase-like domain-containing protein [Rhizophagus irregularis DAOM 181602=DAOM 197198]
MGLCKKCNQKNAEFIWCKTCNAKRFQQNFENWTSGNNDIDKFIQNTQLLASKSEKVLEWIPYDRFYDIEYIAKGGFGKIYKAIWTDGFITNWDNEKQNWKRICQDKDVALKSLNNSKNVTVEFLNEITSHHKIEDNFSIINIYGITQEPETKNYMIILDYAEHGSLRNYLDIRYNKISWYTKRCLDANPLNRPKANEIEFTLYKWWSWFDSQIELKKQIKEAEEINNNLLTNNNSISLCCLSYKTHSEAVYTSRLLNFNNLPEPKNTDEYYMQNDNIINMQFSESLQIDISLLDINNNQFCNLQK